MFAEVKLGIGERQEKKKVEQTRNTEMRQSAITQSYSVAMTTR